MRTADGWWIVHGMAAGLAAGAVFAAFQLSIAALNESASVPLRMVAAMAVGRRAFQPSYPWGTAALIAAMIHVLMSIAFALTFIAVVQPRPTVISTSTMIVRASLFGSMLWTVNFYVIGPMLEWTWFADTTVPAIQWAAHTFFFGAVLGTILNRYVGVADRLNRAERPASALDLIGDRRFQGWRPGEAGSHPPGF